ncbi:molybdopterin biosynthesis protein [Thermostilla marina]
MPQEQFLNVIDRDEAERRFRRAISLPVEAEQVHLSEAAGRILAEDIVAQTDVPPFDRSNYDGFAVRAADTFGAAEETPKVLTLATEVIAPGRMPQTEVSTGTAVTIATGAVLPRGADAVVMVEHTDQEGNRLFVRKAVHPGFGISYAGSDIAAGETILRAGSRLTSRETGVLAALGRTTVSVRRRPTVGIISTGDELVAPDDAPTSLPPGKIYDSNSRIIADAVAESGGIPVQLGIVPDDIDRLRKLVAASLEQFDVVLLSGGTSKGAGDLCYRVVRELCEPGIVAHGVALKPGKPICLASHHGKPVVILPGFPTSAIFTFHEFVAPVIRECSGMPERRPGTIQARVPVRIRSEIGRTEYLLVGLIASHGADEELPAAYPMGKGSGSVTTFSQADGFITIDRHTELLEAGSQVPVQLLAKDIEPADLVVIGSHCPGLDYLLGRLVQERLRVRFLAVGSTGGLDALRRGECDVAGIHLFDPSTGQYNRPFLDDQLELIPGYRRMQGIVFRVDDPRFADATTTPPEELVRRLASLPDCLMVNRNQGSGTRILIDRLLAGTQPPGYHYQPKSHHAVAAAVAQGRADWGVAIEPVARLRGLGFVPITEEHYDLAVRKDRRDLPAVRLLEELLRRSDVRRDLAAMHLLVD